MDVMNYVLIAGGVVLAIALVWFICWIFSLRRVVPTNEVHIVRRGNKTQVYGTPEQGNSEQAKQFCGNSYYQFPVSIPILGVTVTVMPLSIFGIDINDYEAFDKDRVPFVVDIQSFFRIANYEVAASRIGQISELRKQLLSIVQGAVRSILAKDLLNEIMGERSKYGKQFTDEVVDELKAWGVETVKNIELMDVRDANNEKDPGSKITVVIEEAAE
jgi:flotillin